MFSLKINSCDANTTDQLTSSFCDTWTWVYFQPVYWVMLKKQHLSWILYVLCPMDTASGSSGSFPWGHARADGRSSAPLKIINHPLICFHTLRVRTGTFRLNPILNYFHMFCLCAGRRGWNWIADVSVAITSAAEGGSTDKVETVFIGEKRTAAI